MFRKTSPSRAKQAGVAGILLVLLILFGLIAIFTLRLDRQDPKLEAERKTSSALAQAKNEMMGWVTTDNGGTNPGRLPCPDQDNDGNSEGAACANPNLGRLPWKTMKSSNIQDGSAETLWLLIAPTFRTNNTAMNTMVTTSLTFNGQPIAAAIIAPGTPLGALNQNRSLVNQNSYTHFLESIVGGNIVSQAISTTFNDRIITITPVEIFTLITNRLARELSLTAYTGTMGSTIDSISNKPTVWSVNNWDSAVDGPPNTTGPAGITASVITLKFQNCNITYTITGSGAVTRNLSTC